MSRLRPRRLNRNPKPLRTPRPPARKRSLLDILIQKTVGSAQDLVINF
jgi:hypothetical protein